MELMPLEKALDYGISVVVILILAYLLWSVLESSKKREDMLMQLLVSIQPTQEGILIILKEMRDDVSEDHAAFKASLKSVDDKLSQKKRLGTMIAVKIFVGALVGFLAHVFTYHPTTYLHGKWGDITRYWIGSVLLFSILPIFMKKKQTVSLDEYIVAGVLTSASVGSGLL